MHVNAMASSIRIYRLNWTEGLGFKLFCLTHSWHSLCWFQMPGGFLHWCRSGQTEPQSVRWIFSLLHVQTFFRQWQGSWQTLLLLFGSISARLNTFRSKPNTATLLLQSYGCAALCFWVFGVDGGLWCQRWRGDGSVAPLWHCSW